MFKSISTKQKLFLNMMISQVGFFAITVASYFNGADMIGVIAVNIIFAIIVASTSYMAMRRIVGGIERFRAYLEELMEFVYMRRNRIVKLQNIANDEIGLVLHEMNNYVDRFDALRKEDMKVLGEIVLMLDKVSQGIFSCRVKSDSHNFMIRALRNTVNKMLDNSQNSMSELKNTLENYSQNNYKIKAKIDERLKEDMLLVMQSVNSLGDSLSSAAQTNLQNGQILETNARNMTNSVHNVTNKAQEQSESLNETTDAVQRITEVTRNNTENASAMAKLGHTVKNSAASGEKLAEQTAVAMNEINEEVTAINDSITVIDQIAFQTNILSLNAAVEAATAGEAGKGFAVVAGEVRNLANRSASAAKDIKDLVESATAKANSGKAISDEMKDGYKELNEHITETLNLIDNVASSSNEQMQGIEQISNTVVILERVTQENSDEAKNVESLATEVLSLSNELLEDAKSKQF